MSLLDLICKEVLVARAWICLLKEWWKQILYVTGLLPFWMKKQGSCQPEPVGRKEVLFTVGGSRLSPGGSPNSYVKLICNRLPWENLTLLHLLCSWQARGRRSICRWRSEMKFSMWSTGTPDKGRVVVLSIYSRLSNIYLTISNSKILGMSCHFY